MPRALVQIITQTSEIWLFNSCTIIFEQLFTRAAGRFDFVRL